MYPNEADAAVTETTGPSTLELDQVLNYLSGYGKIIGHTSEW